MKKREELIEMRGKRTQAQVAKELGVSRQMITMIEIGEREPSRKLTRRMAHFYNVKVETLMDIIDGEMECV